MNKSLVVVHVVAECRDCNWKTTSYKNGQAIAAKHAKSKCHRVSIDVGLAGYYDGREETNR